MLSPSTPVSLPRVFGAARNFPWEAWGPSRRLGRGGPVGERAARSLLGPGGAPSPLTSRWSSSEARGGSPPLRSGISSGMWQAPRAVSLVTGRGEGGTEINAFDRALQDAGVADLNFLRVSSILPPGARIISTQPGDRISAAIGIGMCRDRHGVIMEYAGRVSRGEAERTVRRMVEEGFEIRGLPLDDVHVVGIEHTVHRAGCVVAVALLWPTPTGL